VAAAAGTTWDDFVQKRILGPLDMKRGTSFTTAVALRSGNYASPHRKNDQGKIEVIPWYPMTVPDPAGSVNSTASDLSKWVKFHLGDGTWGGKRLVSAANLAETHSPQTIIRLEGDDKAFQPFTHQMSYCMGWVVQDYRGQLLVSHGGSIDGFRAHFTLVPEAQLGIVLLNNLEGTQMNLAISNSIVDMVLGLAPKDWNAPMLAVVKRGDAAKQEVKKQWRASRRRGTRPSRELSAYAGSYENPAYGTARVALKDGALTWEWSGFKGPLEHFHYDTFTAREEFLGDPTMVFLLGADGDVAGMTFEGQDFAKTGR
jgi:hypothetical protein